MDSFELCFDVVIAGAGACGAVAAIAAHDAGAQVLVLERDPHPMGTSAMSQGVFCAAGSRFQKAAGIEDSPEIFFDDIMRKSRGSADPVIARMIADNSAPTLEWLCDEHGFPWELNHQFRAAYGNSRDRIHGWAGHAGEEMMQWFYRRLSDLQIDVLCSTRLHDIIADTDGQISGIVVMGADEEPLAIGCKALVLACGGFAANRELTGRFIPESPSLRYNGHEGSKGDAIILGEKLGAKLGDMGSYQGYAMLAEPGGISVPPNVLIEGGFIVNSDGTRFTDESEDIAGMMLPLTRQKGSEGWVIFDAHIHAKCDHIPELQDLQRLGVVREWPDLASMANGIRIPAAALGQTLAEIGKAASDGQRDGFGREWDESHVPDGPFRSVAVTGALYHTQGGLCIDGEARVIKSDGGPFANLFAGGGSARSVSGPAHWGYLPAMGLTTAIVGGKVAGAAAGGLATGDMASRVPPVPQP